jgi:hypothetical protein
VLWRDVANQYSHPALFLVFVIRLHPGGDVAAKITRKEMEMEIVTKVLHGNCFEFEVGTTGMRGGDAGHGGRTFFRIGAESYLEVDAQPGGVTLIAQGDWELDDMIEGLRFAVEVLEQSREEGTKAEQQRHRRVD